MSTPEAASEHDLDTRGLFCPMPIIKLAALVKTLPPGDRVVIVSDDRGILEDLPAWCEGQGHILVSLATGEHDDITGMVEVTAHRSAPQPGTR